MAIIHITDQTFEQEVLKSEIPVLIDFWAEWCVAPETQVASANGFSVKAGDIIPGTSLLGWREGRKKVGIVSISRVVSDAGHCKLVRTTSGRSIKVTDDHLFFTSLGWKKAEELSPSDKVAIFPSDAPLTFNPSHKLLVSSDDIQHIASPKMRIVRYIEELSKRDLLPLYLDNPKILLLARLMGSLFSDGNLYQDKKNNYREISFSLGAEEDVKDIVGDLQELGFSITHVSLIEQEGEILGRRFTNRTLRVKCLSTALWLLFKVLGAPVGNKTDSSYRIPSWLMRAPKAVKKEFLAAFLGGDGPKMIMHLQYRKNKNPYNKLIINDIEFHKKSDLVSNGIEFAQQLSVLFVDLGVKVRKVLSEEEQYERKDGTRSVIIHLQFTSDFANGLALAQSIGYRYCQQKQINAIYVGEFLREIEERKKQWRFLYKNVMRLAEKGFGYRKVSRILDISPHLAFNWIKKRDKATSPKHRLKFPDWLSESTRGLKDGFVWSNIKSIKPVFLPLVSRITVDPTHNFIANSFLVHNCMPCHAVAPILEELEKEYEGKVKFVKLNVDQNTQSPATYGIMSIPTTIVFKAGTPQKTVIGAQSKDIFKKAIEEVLGS